MDYAAPLRWEHEDGRTGVEVSQVPTDGTVFFYDAYGPVGRFTDIAQARWWWPIKIVVASGREHRFCVTRLEDRAGRFHYLLAGTAGVIDCDDSHPCTGFPCVVVDDLCESIVRAAA